MHAGSSIAHRVVFAVVIVLLMWDGRVVQAYQTSLDSKSIEEVYLLGQRNDKAAADSLAQYLAQGTEEGPDGLHRADVELLTPFLQILDRARDASHGYSLTQAKKDYRERGNSIVVESR